MLIRGVKLATEGEIRAFYAGMRELLNEQRLKVMPGLDALLNREEARALELFRRTKGAVINECRT